MHAVDIFASTGGSLSPNHCAIILGLVQLVTALSSNSAILNCLSSGSALAVGQLYLIEISTTSTRGFITGKTLLWIVFYNLVNYVLGAVVSWRSIAITNGFIQLVYLFFTWIFIPESPTWLLAKGQRELARKSFSFLCRSFDKRY